MFVIFATMKPSTGNCNFVLQLCLVVALYLYDVSFYRHFLSTTNNKSGRVEMMVESVLIAIHAWLSNFCGQTLRQERCKSKRALLIDTGDQHQLEQSVSICLIVTLIFHCCIIC